MKKKIAALFTTLSACALLALDFAACNGGSDLKSIEPATEGLEFFSLPDGTYAVAQGNIKPLEIVIIPATHNGKKVTAIAENGFKKSMLTSITIPDSVTNIGASAFSDCYFLTSVYITDINAWCNISFDSYDANPLSCAGYLYLNNNFTTDLVIPDTVTEIKPFAFRNCDSLKSITLPDSVTSIGNSAFSGCSDLTSITIPDSVTNIGDYAFYDCGNLTRVTIPDSVTSIGYNAFYDCDGLQYCVKDNLAYLGNANNPYIYLASALSRGITTATLEDGCKFIGNSAFDNCSSLTSITIPDGVTSIGSYAFYGCSSLTSITIPDSVTNIGDDAFSACGNLMRITVDGNNEQYKDIDGNLYSKDGAMLIQYAMAKKAGNFVIPDSVTNIGNSAFYKCDNLTSITIPDSVTSIGQRAFSSCSRLTSITIPDSVISIGQRAFESCDNLTSITIPDSVTSIGSSAFSGCSSLQYNIKGNLKYLGNANNPYVYLAHTLSTGITTATLEDGCKFIGNSAFSGCLYLISVTISDSVTSIGDAAFYNCSSLTSITIGNSVTSIGGSAFSDCSSLTSVYYKGTASEWSKISIDSGNSYLTSATRYYYSESKPTTTGEYWHYVDGIPTAWL